VTDTTIQESLGPIRSIIPSISAPDLPPGKTIPYESIQRYIHMTCECNPNDTRRLCWKSISFILPIAWFMIGDRVTVKPIGSMWEVTAKNGKTFLFGSPEGTSLEYRSYTAIVTE
jgi:hypothetical protein